MARGVNKVIIIGNLGEDPTVRYMPQGGAVANLTVATSESWTDKTTNEKKEKTEWHRVVIYQRLAEIAGEYLRKGSKVYIEGKLSTRKWQDKDGSDRYTTEIVCNEMQMLEKPAQQQGYQQPQQPQQKPQQAQQSQKRPAPQGYQNQMGQNPNQQQYSNSNPPIDFEDDIPF